MNDSAKREQLGDPDLKIEGFQLWVHGRQFADSKDFYDGNWLNVTAHCGAQGASIWASGPILSTTNILSFRDGCAALQTQSSARAELYSYEPNLRLEIKKLDSLGHFEMIVEITPEHLTQKHQLEFQVDQTYLQPIIDECAEILKRWPIRGEQPV